MKLDEWVRQQAKLICDFRKWWLSQKEGNSSVRLDAGDWDEQFAAWEDSVNGV